MQSDRDVHEAAAAPRADAALPPFVAAASGEGWFAQIGLELLSASSSEVLAEWSIAERHLQPHGIVHGGVYASVVESCCSIGALLAAPAGKQVVGVENHTSFVRP